MSEVRGKKKICVVTGTRAEFGLLSPLMKRLQAGGSTELSVIVTGMHLSPEFGLTWRDIEAAGFSIDERVELLLSSDSLEGIAQSVGLGVIGFSGAFSRLRPDCAVILGDRYEMLAAAQAAYILAVPIAHIGGGETTEGAFDEGIRHAITKFATLHFTSAEPYARRVIQMGEDPGRVFCVGAMGLDALAETPRLSREELERALDFCLRERNFLVTYHPATRGEEALAACAALLRALDRFPGAGIMFTYPNSDASGRGIIRMIREYAAERGERCRAYVNLGQLRYLSLMAQVDLVIGNSSSGIIEAPSLGVPTVNIGDRQKGRLRAESVIDCGSSEREIAAAMERGLDAAFNRKAARAENPYGSGRVSEAVFQVIRDYDFSKTQQKAFYDASFTGI